METCGATNDLSIMYLRQNGTFPVQVSVTPNGLADAATDKDGETVFAVPEERQMTLEELCSHLGALKLKLKVKKKMKYYRRNMVFRHQYYFSLNFNSQALILALFI